MKSWGALTLIGHCREGFPSRNTEDCLLLRNAELKSNSWPEIIENSSLWRGPTCRILLKSLGYIQSYRMNSSRAVQSSCNCIRLNYQKICSWMRRHETRLYIRKKGYLSKQVRLIRWRGQHLRTIEKKRSSMFTFLKNYYEFAKSSISKFNSFKNPFAVITSRFERAPQQIILILLVQM